MSTFLIILFIIITIMYMGTLFIRYKDRARARTMILFIGIGFTILWIMLFNDGEILPFSTVSSPVTSNNIQEIPENIPSETCEISGSYAYIEYKSKTDCEGLEQHGNEWVTQCECDT